jgi:hypothetical protein
MSELGRICPVWGLNMSGHRDFVQQQSRPGDKMMRLDLDKLTISKLDNMELREITGTTRNNLNSSIQI